MFKVDVSESISIGRCPGTCRWKIGYSQIHQVVLRLIPQSPVRRLLSRGSRRDSGVHISPLLKRIYLRSRGREVDRVHGRAAAEPGRPLGEHAGVLGAPHGDEAVVQRRDGRAGSLERRSDLVDHAVVRADNTDGRERLREAAGVVVRRVVIELIRGTPPVARRRRLGVVVRSRRVVVSSLRGLRDDVPEAAAAVRRAPVSGMSASRPRRRRDSSPRADPRRGCGGRDESTSARDAYKSDHLFL